MPVQPPSKDTEEMEAEGDSAAEMNGEEEESEEERSGSQTESEEESSEMDEEDCERRRSECVSEMMDLEKQFSELKEKLFRERLSQLRVRLEEVGAERAPEYTEPLGGLQRSLKIRIQVAGIYKGFCLDVIRNKYECELQGAKQHLESEKLLLYDTLQGELQERIQRLEEDRQSLDISSGDRHPGGLDGHQKGEGSCVPSEEKIRWTLTLLFTARGAPWSSWHQTQDWNFPAAERQTGRPLGVCPAISPVLLQGPPLQPSLVWAPLPSPGPEQPRPGAARGWPDGLLPPQPAHHHPLPKVTLLGALPDEDMPVLSQSNILSLDLGLQSLSWVPLHRNSEPEIIFEGPACPGCCWSDKAGSLGLPSRGGSWCLPPTFQGLELKPFLGLWYDPPVSNLLCKGIRTLVESA
ncbi:breast cancer metastasis-suppressor 1 isoform X1 [Bos mutus]|uniref:breast cancer metastasis-suppressor 1 isoform X1 n=1 Tax=Bos mutus TaxID=72004 RepID=UPI0038B4633B